VSATIEARLEDVLRLQAEVASLPNLAHEILSAETYEKYALELRWVSRWCYNARLNLDGRPAAAKPVAAIDSDTSIWRSEPVPDPLDVDTRDLLEAICFYEALLCDEIREEWKK
jgi:hypothetical protein